MSTVVCPHCSCRQPAGDECRICHGSLTKVSATETERRKASLAAAGIPQVVAAPGKKYPGVLRKLWRISNWMSVVAVVVVLVLILRPAPPPVVHVDPQAMARAEAKVSESKAAASSGRPTALRFDEAELNAFLDSSLGLEGAPKAGAAGGGSVGGGQPSIDEVRSNVKDVKVTMQDDRVQAYLLFDFHGKDLTLVLEGRLAAKDGYLRFEPTGGKIGSLPIPQSTLQSAVDKMLYSPENRDKLRLPDGVGAVRIENGQLVVAPKE